MKQIRITNDTGVGFGTKIVDVETGMEIASVESIAISRFGPGDPIRAELKLVMVNMDIAAEGRFMAVHPKTGDLSELRSLTFVDGETVEF